MLITFVTSWFMGAIYDILLNIGGFFKVQRIQFLWLFIDLINIHFMLITLYEFLLFAFIIYIVFLIAIRIVFVNNFLMLAVVITSFSYFWYVLAKCVENFAFAFMTVFMNAYFLIWCFQHFKNSNNDLWWLKFGRM